MLQESKRLTAKALINYANLPTNSFSIFDKSGEYMGRRVKRPGCPLSEKDLKRQLIDCVSSVLKDLNFSARNRQNTIARLETSKPEQIGQVLYAFISE